MITRRSLLFGGAASKLLAASGDKYPVRFQDVAAHAGLTEPTVYGGAESNRYILETTGSGAAFFDYDNDGWPDIFLVNGSSLEGYAKGQAPTSHLYRNNGDGTFTDVTKQAGLWHDDTRWSTGCAFLDYDHDGKLDLFVSKYVDFDPKHTPEPG